MRLNQIKEVAIIIIIVWSCIFVSNKINDFEKVIVATIGRILK